MLKVLANRPYRHLFFAQVIALVGTGLATVALGLLAYAGVIFAIICVPGLILMREAVGGESRA